MTSVHPLGTDFVTIRNPERALQSQSSPEAELNNLEQVIGRLPDSERYDYVNQQSRAYDDLTNLLLKRAPAVVRTYVTGLLTQGYVSPFTTFLLPIRQLQPGEGITVRWTEINFDPGLAPQVEVEGIAPIWTHNETERGAKIVRRAAGAKIEMGFWNEPEGQQRWIMKLNHMASIILRTTEFNIMLTLLNAPRLYHRHANEMNGPYNVYGSKFDLTTQQKVELEIRMYGLMNKSQDTRAFLKLTADIKENMAMNGVQPDYLIAPPGMMQYMYFTKADTWAYDQAGPNMNENHARAQELNTQSAFKGYEVAGMRIIDTCIYRPTNGSHSNETSDMLSLVTQIGEFYPVEIDEVFADMDDFKRYKTQHRNIKIFNEKQGRITEVKLRHMIEHCLRWNPDGSLHPEHRNFGDADDDNDVQDMFQLGRDEGGKKWVEVVEKFIPAKYHARVIQTFFNKYTDDDRKELDNLVQKVVDLSADGLDQFRNETGALVVRAGNEAAFNQARVALLNKIKQVLLNRVLSVFNACTNSQMQFRDMLTPVGAEDQNKWAFKEYDQRSWLSTLSSGLSPLGKALLSLWSNLYVNRDSMIAMADNDILVPVNFLLSRPYMTYVTSSCIFMKGGRDTGETVIGKQDFRIAPNDMDRTLFCSMVYYEGEYLRKPRNVVVAPNVFIREYVKGNDTSFIKESDLGEIREKGGLKHSQNSILCYMIPPVSTCFDNNVIDIRGRCDDLNNNSEYFPCSMYYENRLSIDPADVDSVNDPYFDFEGSGYKCKTLVCLGHLEYGENFSKINSNTGHLGPFTYDHVNLSRTPSQYTPIKHVTYNANISLRG